MSETLREAGLAEPFPRAFDPDSYRVSAADLRELLQMAGLRDVRVETVILDARWQTASGFYRDAAGDAFRPAGVGIAR